MSKSATEWKTCSICQRYFQGFDCNAWPVNEGRCCEECDMRIVLSARITIMYRKERLQKMLAGLDKK